jgi:hypothetical protein
MWCGNVEQISFGGDLHDSFLNVLKMNKVFVKQSA